MEGSHEPTENNLSSTSIETKKSSIKNLIVLSSSAMLLFLASQSVDRLQSSVHLKGGLGTYSLAAVNACNFLGSLLFSAALVRRYGPKLVLHVSMLSYAAYIAANFDLSGYSLIPLACLYGFGISTLYTAVWTYIGSLGSKYSQATGLQLDIVYARFYGLFFVITQSSSIWGNLITFEVLDHREEETNTTMHCGAEFCDVNVSKKDTNFSVGKSFYILCGTFVCVSVLSMVVLMFVDRQEAKSSETAFTFRALVETGRKIADPLMLLVFPITLYGGLQTSFLTGDYTKAYITCEFGVANVGHVFICYGVVSTIFCAVSSYMVKVIGRRIVFALSAVTDIGVYFALAYHDYRGAQGILLLFVIVGLIAITQGVWQAQVKALYGALFPDCQEVAFSVLGIYQSLGFFVGYFYSPYVCTQIKLYVLLAVLVLSMVCYGIVEILHSKKNSENVGRSG